MNLRKNEVIPMDIQDAKLRIYVSLKNVYRHFMKSNRINEAQELVKAFKIDFANDESAGEFLYKTCAEINNSLKLATKNIKQICLSKKDNIDDSLKKELSQHLFAKQNHYIKNIKLASILTYSTEDFVLKFSEDPLLARQPISALSKQYNIALSQLNNKLEKLESDLNTEINHIFNSLLQERIDEHNRILLEEYKNELLEIIKQKLIDVRTECLNCLLLLRYIDFDDIHKTIQFSIGLNDSDLFSKPLINYISSMIHVKNLLMEIPNHYYQQAKLDSQLFNLSTFINSNNKTNHNALLNNVILSLEKIERQNSKRNIIHERLTKLSEQEKKVFTDKSVNFQDGYFFHLIENLNTIQNLNDYDKLFDDVCTFNLSADNEQLNHLFKIHADLIHKKNVLKERESAFFEMDDINDINAEINSEHGHDNISSIKHNIDKITKLYIRLLAGEIIPEFELDINSRETTKSLTRITNDAQTNAVDDTAVSSQNTLALEENIKLIDKNSKLKLKNARLRLEFTQIQQLNTQLKSSIAHLNNENTLFKDNNSRIQYDYNLLKSKQQNMEKDYIALQRIESENKLQQIQIQRDNMQLRIQNSKLTIDKIINNFNLFYKAYRNNATKGFLGYFTSHGNKGRDCAYNFKNIFENRMQAMRNENSIDPSSAIKILQNQFITLIAEQADNLTGNYKPYSFKTYLLSYNDYLNACIQNPQAIAQEDIVKNYHDDKYVAEQSLNIKNIYDNSFTQNNRQSAATIDI